MSTTDYFQLSSSTMNPYTLVRGHQESVERWLCKACGEPRVGIGPINIAVQETRADPSCLNMISGTGIGVIQVELLNALARAAEVPLRIGDLETGSGRAIQGYKTFHGDPRVLVRGERNASCRKCSDCGRALYYAVGRRYLCPVGPEAAIVYSGLGGLVVNDRVFNVIAEDTWKKLVVDRLPVLLQPLDGLPREI